MHVLQLDTAIQETLLSAAALAQAQLLLEDFDLEPYTAGESVHPGDPFGQIVAWLWSQDEPSTMRFLADFIAQVRNHRPDSRSVRLEDVLTGLRFAWPESSSPDDLERLQAKARTEVPSLYGLNPNTP